jgi:hypothetical protein
MNWADPALWTLQGTVDQTTQRFIPDPHLSTFFWTLSLDFFSEQKIHIMRRI